MAWIQALLMLHTAWAADLRIAVAPFDDGGGEGPAGLGVGLQSMITTDLAQAEQVDVVERARLQDLLDEMQLGARGVLDPATAAELGKVAGATHVVTGSYTVVGATMRLDARVAEVATGKITAAAEASGQKDAFFELEKQIVTALLAGLGTELSAKERAAIGRVHTADFGAFADFSRAVALYDADRYAEAVTLLEGVAAVDDDFKLAKVTLADIEAVRDAALERARAATIASAETAFVAHREGAAREAAWVDELRAIGRDATRDWRDRATADLLLFTGLGRTNHGGFHTLKDSADAFALDRIGDVAYQALWNELRPKVPDWFPAIEGPSPWFDASRGWDLPHVMKENREDWFDGDNHYLLLSGCGRAFELGTEPLRSLWVPQAALLDLRRALLQDTEGCGATPSAAGERREAWLDLAEEYTRLGRVATSTEILKRLASSGEDPRFLAQVAEQAKRNAARQQELDSFPVGSREHELMAHRGLNGAPPSPAHLRADAESIPHKLNWHVRGAFPFHDPFFVNGLPMWSVTRKSQEVTSGARTGIDESASLRHYRDQRAVGPYHVKQPEPATVWVIGGVPRADLSAAVTVDFTPAADWWPRQFPTVEPGWAPLPDRPAAGLIVGLVEIETSPICDPTDPTKVTPIPTRAWGALIREGELQIVRFDELFPEPDRCNTSSNPLRGLTVAEVLDRKPMKRDRAELTVEVSGRTITASAGGSTVKASLPAPPAGFPGLYADGLGYVELAEPRVK